MVDLVSLPNSLYENPLYQSKKFLETLKQARISPKIIKNSPEVMNDNKNSFLLEKIEELRDQARYAVRVFNLEQIFSGLNSISQGSICKVLISKFLFRKDEGTHFLIFTFNFQN